MVLVAVLGWKRPNGCARMHVLSRDELVGCSVWESQLLSCDSKAQCANYTCDAHRR